MWWKLTGLALIEAALIAVLLWPIKTHAVKLDMPAPGSAHNLPLVLDVAALGALLAIPAITIVALCLPIWMAYRVIAKRETR
jgi:hypothetical protein